MRPVVFFTLLIVTVVAMLGMFQIPLVQDAVANTGFPSNEVEAGMVGVLFMFYVLVGVFTVR